MSTTYYPISVCRSDGVQEYFEDRMLVKNEPSNNIILQSAKNQGHFSRLDLDGFRAQNWKRKLAEMLMTQLGPVPGDTKEYILKDIPDGYVLWERTSNKPPQAQSGEASSKATSQRSDVYLYGHPGGRKKRFRSPGDFLPHLIWLSTDTTGNRANCKCVHCVSTQDISIQRHSQPAPSVPVNQTAPPIQLSNSIEKPSIDPATLASMFLYRPGEIVWFSKQQQATTTWGLAVIGRRFLDEKVLHYVLQPLSHPHITLTEQTRNQNDIRPYLAWSVPPITTEGLRGLTYSQVDWQAAMGGTYGPADYLEVDGSILAAKAVDASYSLIDPVKVLAASPSEFFYGGIYLGTEQILVGEPVRLKTAAGTSTVVLVVTKIKESVDPMTRVSTVAVIGDVYSFIEMPKSIGAGSGQVNPHLPKRMSADLEFRNRVAEAAQTNVWRDWRLNSTQVQKSLYDIRGRWYETSKLMPILKGVEEFEREKRTGNAGDTDNCLNGRGDNNDQGMQRKLDRIQALDKAVPHTFRIEYGPPGQQNGSGAQQMNRA